MGDKKILFETNRLLFRELHLQDWQAFHSYASDERALKFQDWEKYSEEKSQQFIKDVEKVRSLYPRMSYYLGVEKKAEDDLIGSGGLYIKSFIEKKATLGYIFHPDHWGNGFATESIAGWVSFGFKQLKLKTTWAYCHPQNIASWKALESNHFIREELVKDQYIIRGKSCDAFLYKITNTSLKLETT